MAAEAARSMSCPACLDLDYDRYDIPLREPYFYEGQSLRYHITSFWELEQRATQGCKFCDVLHRGISAVWDVAAVGLTDHAVSEREQQLRRSTWPIPGTLHHHQHERRDSKMIEMASYRPRQRADMRRAEEDEHTKFYRPCIELRPGRSVLVSHALYKRVVPTEGGNGYKLGQNPLEFEHFMRRAPLEFYTLSGTRSIHPAFGHKDHIPATLTPAHYQRKLTQWMTHCTTHHRLCADPTPTAAAPAPKRLIHIDPSTAPPHLSLVETAPALTPLPYTTLSHCWGPPTSPAAAALKKTVRANLAAHLAHGIDFASLPRLFRDAVAATLMAGCCYLWIDSLCIVQDDPADWRDHAYHRMADIYARSHFNIAATALADSEGGFPEDPASPLLQRGWVFQERLLSRRTLHCTASELVWECRERTWCECGDLGESGSGNGVGGAGDGDDDDDDGDGIGAVAQRRSTKIQFQNMFEPGATPRSLLYDWMSIVTRYNHLQFTNPSDLPFAFAGVVQKVRDRMQDSGGRYVAGLWTADLPRNLLWVGKKKRLDHEKGSRLYPVDWESFGSGPPSWSWIWTKLQEDGHREVAEIKSSV
ncbi:putative het domain-containing protein [Diplodia seriata]|uniref:Putative het domain-containing protein n=1 Tax=Diplodia seriata TaxID=420778 RepID=A0A0G2GQF5_9PEZI|nr:putative het domain-containing protein [Diplodia seriata]